MRNNTQEDRASRIEKRKDEIKKLYNLWSGGIHNPGSAGQYSSEEIKRTLLFRTIGYFTYTRENPQEHNEAFEFIQSKPGLLELIEEVDKHFVGAQFMRTNYARTKQRDLLPSR